MYYDIFYLHHTITIEILNVFTINLKKNELKIKTKDKNRKMWSQIKY